MALDIITSINVDFYDKKYILINAKQNDRSSRFLSVACYSQGELFTLNSAYHTAYIRYRKADEHSVFNICEIREGKVIVELTEQMLAADGFCYADLMIVEGGKAVVDDNGFVTGIENSSILSTMTFCIDVSETAIDKSQIESNYEINILNETLDKYEADYQNVVKMARSWAEGNTGIRDGENTHNAKYYAELAVENAFGVKSLVTGIKCTNDTDYRVGQVDINASHVGAISIDDMATVNEVKDYLGIQ